MPREPDSNQQLNKPFNPTSDSCAARADSTFCRGTAAGDRFGNLGFQGVKLGIAAADDLQVAPLKGDEFAAEGRQLQLGLGKLRLKVFQFRLLAPEFLLLRRTKSGGFRGGLRTL